jgi:hypothetical protein
MASGHQDNIGHPFIFGYGGQMMGVHPFPFYGCPYIHISGFGCQMMGVCTFPHIPDLLTMGVHGFLILLTGHWISIGYNVPDNLRAFPFPTDLRLLQGYREK